MPLPPSMRQVEMSPMRFYALTETLLGVGQREVDIIVRVEDKAYALLHEIERQVIELGKANNTLNQEIRRTTRRKTENLTDLDDEGIEELLSPMKGHSFIHLAFDVLRAVSGEVESLYGLCQDLRPGDLILTGTKHDPKKMDSVSALEHMLLEFQLNKPVLDRHVSSVMRLARMKSSIYDRAMQIEKVFDNYYQKLQDRHTTQGIQVHMDPVVTDVAISVYENVDSHGEIEDGKDAKELSAYSVRKATIICDAVKTGPIRALIDNPKSLTGKVAEYLKKLWDIADELCEGFEPIVKRIEEATELKHKHSKEVDDHDFLPILHALQEELDPNSIVYKEKAVLLTAEERFNLAFKNKTLSQVAQLIKSTSAKSKDLVDYILARKQELRDYFRDENSFYVCKIGQGNPFAREAPGALQVVPGARPNISLDEILGAGFADVREFASSIEAASEFSDLFMATSPSKTTDKSNVLLIGPQGCGKTEVLRGMGGDKKSIGIFAQGSDFLTCWMGEADKNPKRLFEAAIRIQKEARRHVHILIDEIDSILNNDRDRSRINLTLEFQILMDGIVHYPHLSVWGATNSPERIPMPMIRRFSKVLIVGELDQDHRIKLMQHFVGYMPVADIEEREWKQMADKLDGATGDVIRKIVDHVWRSKMTWFTQNHRVEAKKLVEELNQEEKFQIANFSAEKRAEFKKRLAPFLQVSGNDLMKSVDLHLENVAIHHEIETAKKTYADAKQFLAQIKQGEV